MTTAPLPIDFDGLQQDVGQEDNTGAGTVIRAIVDNDSGVAIFIPDVVVEEQHNDQMVITDHPVERGSGAFVSDHAYKLPAELLLTYGWSPTGPGNWTASPTYLLDVYQTLLDYMAARTLISVYTGKRTYTSMLLAAVTLTTDRLTENALILRILCREILLAETQVSTVSFNPKTQLDPSKTLSPQPVGIMQPQGAPTFNEQDFDNLGPP